MNVTRLLTTLLAAAAVSGGISVAVAQSVTPKTPAPAVEYDSGARTPPAAPAAQAAPAQAAPAPMMATPAASEPMPQPTRG